MEANQVEFTTQYRLVDGPIGGHIMRDSKGI